MSRPASELTTHANWGEGNPRVVITGSGRRWEAPLQGRTIRIGAAIDSDIRVGGIDPHAAEILHDDHDEFVYIPHQPGETNAVLQPMDAANSQPGEILRHGAHFTLGAWSFVFMREEFADHGLPHGGHEGGEGTKQPMQPAGPDYPAQQPREA